MALVKVKSTQFPTYFTHCLHWKPSKNNLSLQTLTPPPPPTMKKKIQCTFFLLVDHCIWASCTLWSCPP